MNKRDFLIDLNLDAGESEIALQNGSEEKLYGLVSSVNIACGGHAGNSDSMARAVESALPLGLHIGAHPSYPDRANFGRKKIEIEPSQLADSIQQQVEALELICRRLGAEIHHIKPHGALYNAAAEDVQVCEAFKSGVAHYKSKVKIVGLAGSLMIQNLRADGFVVLEEAFADRVYESSTKLRPRSLSGSQHEQSAAAAAQVHEIVFANRIRCFDGSFAPLKADTICVHGDHPRALEIAVAVNRIVTKR